MINRGWGGEGHNCDWMEDKYTHLNLHDIASAIAYGDSDPPPTALQLASRIVRRLRLGPALDHRDGKRTRLHDYALDGRVYDVAAQLAAGTPVDALDGFQNTPLDCAAYFSRIHVIRLLLAAGAVPTVRSLACATHCSIPVHEEVCLVLVGGGAPIDKEALQWARCMPRRDWMRRMYERWDAHGLRYCCIVLVVTAGCTSR